MYQDSVYPGGHFGATGTAFAAGAAGKNLTEWQYGLASVRPRWNVSGTYMQVLPRFISRKEDGTDEKEFLYDFFEDSGELLTMVFLKGYQWPFDVRKVENGSSIIDILVYLEQKKGRRVFLDFRSNPNGQEIDYSVLSDEAYDYLNRAGACFGTPLDRLLHMNRPAVDFYMEKGVDLSKEPLEIALCAQHNNGGLSIDAWWQTNINGLFAVGEAAASHGVYRPGGSALNAGQVGSARAAQYIAAYGWEEADGAGYKRQLAIALMQAEELSQAVQNPVHTIDIWKIWEESSSDMSRYGASIRSKAGIEGLLERVKTRKTQMLESGCISSSAQLWKAFRLRDMLICQQVYLEAMLDYLKAGGGSRGSALYSNAEGIHPHQKLPEEFTYKLDNGKGKDQIQEVMWNGATCEFRWRTVRPIPDDDDFFENVWREYRNNKNIY